MAIPIASSSSPTATVSSDNRRDHHQQQQQSSQATNSPTSLRRSARLTPTTSVVKTSAIALSAPSPSSVPRKRPRQQSRKDDSPVSRHPAPSRSHRHAPYPPSATFPPPSQVPLSPRSVRAQKRMKRSMAAPTTRPLSSRRRRHSTVPDTGHIPQEEVTEPATSSISFHSRKRRKENANSESPNKTRSSVKRPLAEVDSSFPPGANKQTTTALSESTTDDDSSLPRASTRPRRVPVRKVPNLSTAVVSVVDSEPSHEQRPKKRARHVRPSNDTPPKSKVRHIDAQNSPTEPVAFVAESLPLPTESLPLPTESVALTPASESVHVVPLDSDSCPSTSPTTEGELPGSDSKVASVASSRKSEIKPKRSSAAPIEEVSLGQGRTSNFANGFEVVSDAVASTSSLQSAPTSIPAEQPRDTGVPPTVSSFEERIPPSGQQSDSLDLGTIVLSPPPPPPSSASADTGSVISNIAAPNPLGLNVASYHHNSHFFAPTLWHEDAPKMDNERALWKFACKTRVWDVRRRYTPETLRSVVLQEAQDYFSVKGYPKGFNKRSVARFVSRQTPINFSSSSSSTSSNGESSRSRSGDRGSDGRKKGAGPSQLRKCIYREDGSHTLEIEEERRVLNSELDEEERRKEKERKSRRDAARWAASVSSFGSPSTPSTSGQQGTSSGAVNTDLSSGDKSRSPSVERGFMDEEYYDFEIRSEESDDGFRDGERWSEDGDREKDRSADLDIHEEPEEDDELLDFDLEDEDEDDDDEDYEDFESSPGFSAGPALVGNAVTHQGAEEADQDAEGEMEADLEPFLDPSFNAELSSPSNGRVSAVPRPTAVSAGVPLPPPGPSSALMASFFVPVSTPQYFPPNLSTPFGSPIPASFSSPSPPPRPPTPHPMQQQPPYFSAQSPMPQYAPPPQYYHRPPPGPVLPLPPPRLHTIPVQQLRNMEFSGKLIGKGTPPVKEKGLEWVTPRTLLPRSGMSFFREQQHQSHEIFQHSLQNNHLDDGQLIGSGRPPDNVSSGAGVYEADTAAWNAFLESLAEVVDASSSAPPSSSPSSLSAAVMGHPDGSSLSWRTDENSPPVSVSPPHASPQSSDGVLPSSSSSQSPFGDNGSGLMSRALSPPLSLTSAAETPTHQTRSTSTTPPPMLAATFAELGMFGMGLGVGVGIGMAMGAMTMNGGGSGVGLGVEVTGHMNGGGVSGNGVSATPASGNGVTVEDGQLVTFSQQQQPQHQQQHQQESASQQQQQVQVQVQQQQQQQSSSTLNFALG